MSHSSSSSASCSSSSTRSSDTAGTSILEAHHVDEVPLDVFSKALLNFEVTDARGRPFELNQRVSTAIATLGKAKDLTTSICNVLNRIINIYNASSSKAAAAAVKFVDHSSSTLLHHPDRASAARPQLVAVPECIAKSWSRDAKARSKRRANLAGPAIAWHHVLATVLIADERQPIDQIVDFLGALNQARPDLPGCFSLTATRQACRLWWSDAAGIYTTPSLHWDDPATATYLLMFVCRMSHPLAIDPTVSLEAMSQPPAPYDRRPVWLVHDAIGGAYRAEHTIAVGKPWSRKNWIVAATEYRARGTDSFTPCSRVVIKDSFSLVDNEGHSEGAILEHLHADGPLAGITMPIASFLVSDGVAHIQNVQISGFQVDVRRKHRLILPGTGQDLYQCPSVLHFLMTMYDALEAHRHVHEQREVLHRDISLRNVLYNNSLQEQPPSTCTFAKDILAHHYPASRLLCGAACTLIDFDNAAWEGHSPECALRQSVGTPSFVARAVSASFSLEYRYEMPPIPELSGNAKACYIQAFGPERYAACSTLHSAKLAQGPMPIDRAKHGPRHDAESCFWLTLHFLVTALPRGASRDEDELRRANEVIHMLEANQVGSLSDPRGSIFFLGPRQWESALHPGLRALAPFVFAMASTIHPSYEFAEPAPPPYHLHEALQRIILQEMCRLLDTDEISLNIHERRAVDSRFNELPSAVRPAPAAVSKKRSAEGPDRQDGRPRPRLSI